MFGEADPETPSLKIERKPSGLAEYAANSLGNSGLAEREFQLCWNNPASAVSAVTFSAAWPRRSKPVPEECRVPRQQSRANNWRSMVDRSPAAKPYQARASVLESPIGAVIASAEESPAFSFR